MEIWKPIKDYEDKYEVSNLGNVRSLDSVVENKLFVKRIFKGRIKKQNKNKYGYIYTNLYKDKKPKNKLVHRLVAESFIDNPERKPQVNHINGIKDDNRVENLEWVTASENAKHAYKIGKHTQKGIKNAFSKLTEENIISIRKESLNTSQYKLAKKYNVSQACISKVVLNKTWKHIPEEITK